MPNYERGGHLIGGMQLGRTRAIRQEILHAGETVQPHIMGQINLNALREQVTRRIHVTLAQFFTPLRWLEPQWANMIKQGEDWAGSIDTYTFTDVVGDLLGVGRIAENDVIWQVWLDNYLQIYNWHWKWPQDADRTAIGAEDEQHYGFKAVNLATRPHARILTDSIVDADHELTTEQDGSREKFSVRALSQLQARLRSESDRMYFGEDRYRDLLTATWRDAIGTSEVDQIPIRLDVEAGYMDGQDLYASDGDSLGSKAGIMEFKVNHQLPYPFTAPEHGIWACFLCVRLDPVINDGSNLFLTGDDKTWVDFTAHPGHIAKSPPVDVKVRDISPTTDSSTVLGKLPRGWQWRAGWDQIDVRIDDRMSYMFVGGPDNATESRYHQDVDSAFRSTAIGNGLLDFTFVMLSDSQVPPPFASVMSGTD